MKKTIVPLKKYFNVQPWLYIILFSGMVYLILQLRAIWSFTIDDMYISLRYAKHWFLGEGLVWNLGEKPVEGYSNFISVFLSYLALKCSWNPVITLKMIGVLSLGFLAYFLYQLTRFWCSFPLALVPCIWLLAYRGEMIWSVSGLETTLYQAILMAGVVYFFRGLGWAFVGHMALTDRHKKIAWILEGAVSGLATMTRPEAPVVLGLMGIAFFAQPGAVARLTRVGWITIFMSVGMALIWFGWRYVYFGKLWPNPIDCKGWHAALDLTLDYQYFKLAAPFVCLSLFAWLKPDPRYIVLLAPSLIYGVLLWGSDPIVAFDNRLFLPAFSLLLPLAWIGLQQLIAVMHSIPMRFKTMWLWLAAMLWLIFFIPTLSLSEYRTFTQNPQAGEQLRQQVVTWLQQHPYRRIVLGDSGYIPYYYPGHFEDSYCLNNADMAQQPAAERSQWMCHHVLDTKPQAIILTALVTNGQKEYAPTDDCLATQLKMHKQYQRKKIFSTVATSSRYQYELFVLKPSKE